jgi:hypothetical protein
MSDPELRGRKIAAALATAAANTRERSTDFLIRTYDELLEDFRSRRELFVADEETLSYDFSKLVE